jgi:hypothetical protein
MQLLIMQFSPMNDNNSVIAPLNEFKLIISLPSLGMVLLLVYGAQLLWGAFLRQRSLLLCAGMVLLVVFCSRTVARNRDWASRQALIR